jgi:CTP:molybdopterin cytidylyltransferase MocA
VTVAAVILADPAGTALADAGGVARVRRISDAAWAGGALPTVVVVADPDGGVANALAGASVILAAPTDDGPLGRIVRGFEVAAAEISQTTAALIWPAEFCWAGPETVTSLVEAHGRAPGCLIRPTYRDQPGWPALVPAAALETIRGLPPATAAGPLVDALLGIGMAALTIDLGDPGTVIDGTTPRTDLPPYEGPATPGGSTEWGAAAAATPEDAPLAGPTVAGVTPEPDEA